MILRPVRFEVLICKLSGVELFAKSLKSQNGRERKRLVGQAEGDLCHGAAVLGRTPVLMESFSVCTALDGGCRPHMTVVDLQCGEYG